MVLAASYLIAFWSLAQPYRFFPSDDRDYYELLLSGGNGFLAFLSLQLDNCYQPVFIHYLSVCRLLWRFFAPDSPNLLIFATLVANTISLVMIVLICRRLIGGLAWSVAAGLIFGASAWTANYYFMFSYAPFALSLILAAFTLQIYGAHSDAGSVHRMFMGSGLLLALAFWCSPSAAVSISLILAMFAPLLWVQGRNRRQILHACAWLTAGFTPVILAFSFNNGGAYFTHIQENINTYHYQNALIKFGQIPTPPFFSFFRLLFEYDPIEAMVFPVLATVTLIILLNRKNRADRGMKICAILGVICLAHTLIVDLLPTTKLGRTNLHAYPFLVLFMVVSGHWLYSQTAGRFRYVLGGFFAVLLLLSISFSINQTMNTRNNRTALPEFLAQFPPTTGIYLLREDPHAKYISQWLDDSRISFVDMHSFGSIINGVKVNATNGMLIIGPTGTESGNSILEASNLPDFNPIIPESLAARITYLPYYAFQPSFLFEEEICLALYFSRKTPQPNNSGSMLKILVW
jgi:hypothetical protein